MACYWVARGNRATVQLIELIEGKEAREAFAAFSAWLLASTTPIRAARRLPAHVEFFVELDRLGTSTPTGEQLLGHFGTARLRAFELPVRWLDEIRGVCLTAESKSATAECGRAQRAVGVAPEGTRARSVLTGFASELTQRVELGELQARSMRMALRPATELMAVADPQWARLPDQAALERYLQSVPGQRAALSTFVGHLRREYQLELQLPPKMRRSQAAEKRRLETQIAALAKEGVNSPSTRKRWLRLGLQLFHGLTAQQASRLEAQATCSDSDDGFELSLDGKTYWLPDRPA